MKKNKFLIIITSIITLLAFNVYADTVKIGYVDLQKIVTSSNQGIEAMRTLDSIEKAKNALIKAKIDEMKRFEEEMLKQAAILTPESKQKKQAELEKKMMEYQRMRKESDAELKKNEAEFIQKIVIDVKVLLKRIADEEGYSAILNQAGVVYMPDGADLTDRVIQEFNALPGTQTQ